MRTNVIQFRNLHRAGAIVALILTATVAGCLSDSQDEDDTDILPASTRFQTDCDLPGATPDEAGVCSLVLSQEFGRHQEVDLAVDPNDPDRIAVAWLHQTRPAWNTLIATTSDGGLNWTHQDVHELLGHSGHTYDPTIAYGGDGTLYLSLGQYGLPERGQMRLLVSHDAGETWQARSVTPNPGPFVVIDAMGLAVAPDTGRLHVVAHGLIALWEVNPAACCVVAGAYHWSSDDAGATWTGPTRLDPLLPEEANERFFWARPAAGHEGLVGVSVKTYAAHYALISQDGGESWLEPRRLHEGPTQSHVTGHPVTIHPDGNISYVHGIQDSLILTHTSDKGDTWHQADLAKTPDGIRHNWQVSDNKQGSLYTLASYGGREDDLWGVYMSHLDHDGAKTWVPLAGPIEAVAPAVQNVDNYGGVGVAQDGMVWTTWSDPRGEDPQIRLARLLDTQPRGE